MDRILIVEDDELIAELEQDYLLVEGMESDIVANGAEAVRRFREREYSAVLLDLMLRGRVDLISAEKSEHNQMFQSFWLPLRKRILIKSKGLVWVQMIM